MISLKLIELVLAITLIIKTVLHAIIDLRYDEEPDALKSNRGIRTYFLMYKEDVSGKWEWMKFIVNFLCLFNFILLPLVFLIQIFSSTIK